MTDSNKKTNADSPLLDSLLAHVAILDTEGTILKSNKSWQSFNSENTLLKRANIGDNYFNVLQHAIEMGDDYALKILLGVKKVIDRESSSFSITYPIETETNSFWFKLTTRPCNTDHTQFVMIHEDVTPSMKAKYEKQENEDRFQVKFEQSPDGIFITDFNGNIIDANQTASTILGWSRNQLKEISMGAVTNVEDPKYREALKQRDKSGTYAMELDFFDKNGNIIPTEVSSRTYRNPNGKLRAIVTFYDISRRKEIEQDLSNTRKFTESALNSIPGVFIVLDRKGNFVRWNENMVTTLGYSAEELTKKKATDFVIDEYKDRVQETIQRCIEEGEVSIETKLHAKNGHIKEYAISAKRFVEDGKVYIVATGIDITKQKKIEQEKQRHQIMMQQLFDNSPVGIAIVDRDNSIQNVNSSFNDIFGYARNEVEGNDINELLAPENKKKEAKAISLATRNGESLQTETIRMNKDGEEIPVLIGSVPVELQGEIIAIYGMYVDVSTQHNYREKLEAALSEKEALLSELHHRVKNNLALINSLVELQLFDAQNAELQMELQNIKNRIMTIASIHEVLYQNGNLTNIPFNTFIDELLNQSVIEDSKTENKVQLNTSSKSIYLNINQSIPTGLLLNELLSLIFAHTNKDQMSEVNIQLKQYGQNVHLVVEGNHLIQCPKEMKQNQSLHNILIQTLVVQLNGTLLWPSPDTDYQKFEFCFTKEEGTSPASDFLQAVE
ncbi:PAS domain S-box protein [Fodinibius sp. Rm-B-1B1-1]|uniref:PAS domain-containing sensor histidine kinase n=1 Tax=Fodinibius alkaliphilus TaxID=3140241 RepID=UPI00315B2450